MMRGGYTTVGIANLSALYYDTLPHARSLYGICCSLCISCVSLCPYIYPHFRIIVGVRFLGSYIWTSSSALVTGDQKRGGRMRNFKLGNFSHIELRPFLLKDLHCTTTIYLLVSLLRSPFISDGEWAKAKNGATLVR